MYKIESKNIRTKGGIVEWERRRPLTLPVQPQKTSRPVILYIRSTAIVFYANFLLSLHVSTELQGPIKVWLCYKVFMFSRKMKRLKGFSVKAQYRHFTDSGPLVHATYVSTCGQT